MQNLIKGQYDNDLGKVTLRKVATKRYETQFDTKYIALYKHYSSEDKYFGKNTISQIV